MKIFKIGFLFHLLRFLLC